VIEQLLKHACELRVRRAEGQNELQYRKQQQKLVRELAVEARERAAKSAAEAEERATADAR
jgi:hypothetical protein